MYRALFIFDFAELRWRLIEAIESLLTRKPDLALVSEQRLEHAWLRRHLHKYHFALLVPDRDDNLIKDLDLDFLEAAPFHSLMYNMFEPALHPRTHPCFYTPARIRQSGSRIILEYQVE